MNFLNLFPNFKLSTSNEIFCFGLSTKKDNDMQNMEHLLLFCKKENIDPGSLILMKQIHGNTFTVINTSLSILNNQSQQPTVINNTDALISSRKNITLGIFTADCLPIFIFDHVKGIYAAIHAGRRGIGSAIHEKVFDYFIQHGCKKSHISVVIGPSIGPCCYPQDLWKIITQYFQDNAINNVYNSRICTSCNNDLFFSYRKERTKAGRMLSYIRMCS